MAKTLAVSVLRFCNEPITILTDRPQDFNNYQIIEIEPTNPFKLKTQLGRMFPDGGIYMDVDAIVGNPEMFIPWMAKAKKARFWIQEHERIQAGERSRHAWATGTALARHYNLSRPFPVYNSSVIVWDSTMGKFWKQVESAYLNPVPGAELICNCYPDEIAFGAASAIMDIYPDPLPDALHFKWTKNTFNEYPIISLAASGHSNAIIQKYNGLARDNARITETEYYPISQKTKTCRSKNLNH